MNLHVLQQKLLAAARRHPPGDTVPYAFEQRILARLPAATAMDPWGWWVRGLWRGAVSCAAICLLLGAWTWVASARDVATDDLSQQFENTVLAAVDQESDSAW